MDLLPSRGPDEIGRLSRVLRAARVSNTARRAYGFDSERIEPYISCPRFGDVSPSCGGAGTEAPEFSELSVWRVFSLIQKAKNHCFGSIFLAIPPPPSITDFGVDVYTLGIIGGSTAGNADAVFGPVTPRVRRLSGY